MAGHQAAEGTLSFLHQAAAGSEQAGVLHQRGLQQRNPPLPGALAGKDSAPATLTSSAPALLLGMTRHTHTHTDGPTEPRGMRR